LLNVSEGGAFPHFAAVRAGLYETVQAAERRNARPRRVDRAFWRWGSRDRPGPERWASYTNLVLNAPVHLNEADGVNRTLVSGANLRSGRKDVDFENAARVRRRVA
jgi:hypothetical protein